MAYFDSPNVVIATISVIVFSLLVIGLFVGWLYGARRLNLDLHHWMVYGATGFALLIVILWMGPRVIKAFSYLTNNLPNTLGGLIHAFLGLIVICLMLIVSIAFIIKRSIPLDLLKKMRYLMIAIITIFPIVFALGIINYTRYFS